MAALREAAVGDSAVRRVARKAGVQEDLRRLRHFMGTAMLIEGTDLRTVTDRLGHAGGGATTLRVDTHFFRHRIVGAEQLAKTAWSRHVRPRPDGRTPRPPADRGRVPCPWSAVRP
jgi:integrase